MLTPSLPSRDKRGKHWLLTKTQQILADNAVILATPRSEHDPSCYWGTGLGDRHNPVSALGRRSGAESAALSPDHDRGLRGGALFLQHTAILWIRRTLKKMGLLSA